MLCRSCGCIYFRKNKQGVCLNCYTGGKRRDKITYVKKVWDKFSLEVQEKLVEQYEVFLSYPKPLKQKLKEKLKRKDTEKRKANRKKLGKTFSKIVKGPKKPHAVRKIVLSISIHHHRPRFSYASF